MKLSDILESIDASRKVPLWARIIAKRLEDGRPVYFASGANRIEDIVETKTFDKRLIYFYLVRVNEDGTLRADTRGHPSRQTYTIWEKSFDAMTLEPFRDGIRLVFEKTQKPSSDEGSVTPQP